MCHCAPSSAVASIHEPMSIYMYMYVSHIYVQYSRTCQIVTTQSNMCISSCVYMCLCAESITVANIHEPNSIYDIHNIMLFCI